ncbi:MAG: hypothetical protein OXI38_04650, partial [Bacteroidota bacterium]|nr:hypothetical protein [Bacteroidota bacterium]
NSDVPTQIMYRKQLGNSRISLYPQAASRVNDVFYHSLEPDYRPWPWNTFADAGLGRLAGRISGGW